MNIPEELCAEIEAKCTNLRDGYACLEIGTQPKCGDCLQWFSEHCMEFEWFARIIEVEV